MNKNQLMAVADNIANTACSFRSKNISVTYISALT